MSRDDWTQDRTCAKKSRIPKHQSVKVQTEFGLENYRMGGF